MHGRLKIKTTAEQQEAKRIEREKKLKLYKAGTLKISEKRKKEEYDEEALSLTEDFLLQNPEFYTLWNFRKEILLHLKPQKSEEELQVIGLNELRLTQNCIKNSLKSYGAWHHRFWALEYMPHPDWIKELKLCDLFFSLDERNFHCWDYRRCVVKRSGIDSKQELEFTTDLIEKNFSNYSAWHYRSTLLPVVHPGSSYISVDEETLLKEYEIVQNAAFTDPNDQSVWFYHRWLLGRGNRNLEILTVAALIELKIVIVLFSCPVKVNDDNMELYVNETKAKITWKRACEESKVTTVWYCQLPDDQILNHEPTKVSACFTCKSVKSSLTCLMNGSLSYKWRSGYNALAFSSDISVATKDVLEKELESCQQLFEMEPENKWVLFTMVLLMKAIDSTKYVEDISTTLDRLMEIDSMRKAYYQDLRTKFSIENYIEVMPFDNSELHFCNKHFSSLYHFDYFVLMQKVDLSCNNLSSTMSLQYLLCVKELILDSNKLKDCKYIRNLPCLENLSLQSNEIISVDALQSLTTCTKLKYVFLNLNPLTKDLEYKSLVKSLLGNVSMEI